MNQDNLLLIVAVVAVAITIIGLGVTYNSLSVFNNFLTGFATENGTVSVNIQTIASINITSANNAPGKTLNWGSGTFNAGASHALLVSNGTVVNGTWTSIAKGFVVENVGNLNVTLNISAVSAASTFLGGTSPLFQYKFSNNESGSCTFSAGVENTWKEFTTTSTAACSKFHFVDTSDRINLDILVKIPNNGKTGALTNTVVLTYESV